jgi:L-alanine-DL-glutamate epimerase-like enolase superfamily enzyme
LGLLFLSIYYFKMAPIKSIEYFRVKPRWLFVKITDDQGGYGWGEGTLEGHSLAVEGALDEMITRLIGYDAEYVFLPKKKGAWLIVQ